MQPILNIAGYKFITLTDLSARRDIFLEKTTSLQLKGTILLSSEGVNITLAGSSENIADFLLFLQQETLFADMNFRKSYSDFQPFRHMRVRIKKEIITMGQPDIHPENETAPEISPAEFKKWLDEKRDITVLDTRNGYEVEFGTFDNAKHLDIDDFGEFPVAMRQVATDKPIVMFCTGGIRCEKAGLAMMHAGYSEVYQLKGGILNYFSEVGAAHYHGECFVFDERISVDTNLKPTGTTQCLTCQGPIKSADVSCRNCTTC